MNGSLRYGFWMAGLFDTPLSLQRVIVDYIYMFLYILLKSFATYFAGRYCCVFGLVLYVRESRGNGYQYHSYRCVQVTREMQCNTRSAGRIQQVASDILNQSPEYSHYSNQLL